MINTCDDCGNALGECECTQAPFDLEVSKALGTDTVEVCLTQSTPLTLCATDEQKEALGKEAFLAFWDGVPPYDWETTSNKRNWLNAGEAAALAWVKTRL